MDHEEPAANPAITRRGVLAAGGAAILGAAGGYALGHRQPADPPATAAAAPPTAVPAESAPAVAPVFTPVPFYGEHQAGVETELALFQTFIGLNLIKGTKTAAERVMRLVTDDAARLTQGAPALGDTEPDLALNADQLTISVGLGRSLFERTGLADRIPAQLVEIPSFSTDQFEDPWSQTDLLLQIGANDPVTLSHTVRMLTKDLSTLTRVKWMQPGFRSSAPASMGVASRRNLMGQVEGTHFPAANTPQFATVVWIDEGPDWAIGGTVLVLRRIRMMMDLWDKLDRPVQETVIGRSLTDGALLGSGTDQSLAPLDAVDANGLPVISADAHVRVARADSLEGVIMRRPYNYDNGMHDGTSDVGLLFAAYMRDPRTSFIPTQKRLAKGDSFQRWISTIGSAAYFYPAGVTEGQFIAEGLFT